MYETDLKGVERASFNNQKSDERQNVENHSMVIPWSSKCYLMKHLQKTNSKIAIVSAMNFAWCIIFINVIRLKKDSYESYLSHVSSSCKIFQEFKIKRCFIQMPDDHLQSDFEPLPFLSSCSTSHFLFIYNIQNMQQNNRMDHFLFSFSNMVLRRP